MKRNNQLFVRWRNRNARGQVLVFAALLIVILLGVAGLVIDYGRIYVSQRQLQSSTDASALAGGQTLLVNGQPNYTGSTGAPAIATSYGGQSGGKNYSPFLPGVSMVSGYPLLSCVTTPPWNELPCSSPYSYNAIRVRQQVSVPLFFGSLFGTSSVTLMAEAEATAKGATTPYNVAIIVDTTHSMQDTDSESTCNSTRLSCALQGVQVLLNELSPCAGGLSSCGSNPAVDTVGLYTFPGVASASPDTCGGGNVTTEPYAVPTYTGTYQIVNFTNNYRTSDTSLLSSSSNLVKAVGTTNNGSLQTGTSTTAGCMQAPGGQGTYYAQVIYQATAGLLAQPQANRQNALIILSDGDATATPGAMPGACPGAGSGCTTAPFTGATTGEGTYETAFFQCAQAVTAAQHATQLGITVYTVAYGAEASGCLSDNTYCGSGTYGSGNNTDCVPTATQAKALGIAAQTPNSLTPCTTMEQMASNPSTFFSDYGATGGTNCTSSARPVNSLNQIFQAIGADLTVSRLVPFGTQ